jgi:ATP-binding cassette subfamily B protein
VSFGYVDQGRQVLKNINLKIPEGKVTAIVGSSGSGKTTLLKLLLRFYQPSSGKLVLNGQDIESYSLDWWRSQVGVVMQEGHIFSDTIYRNIVMGDELGDNKRLVDAAETANMEDFLLQLPLHFQTKVGGDGTGLSTGQKQRILIARAVYKNPAFLFLDEATSSLDSKNEKEIMQNLERLFNGRTVVIIAHRLSTVRQADQIAVLEDGEVVELGNHEKLVAEKGVYFELVKNQLEIAD